MDAAKIDKIKSIVKTLSIFSTESEEFRDFEDFCEFKKLPISIFTKHQAALNLMLIDLGHSDYLNPTENEEDNFVDLHFNKTVFKSAGILFFLNQDTYRLWLATIDPFSANNLFNADEPKPFRLIIPGLEKVYFGSLVQLFSDTSSNFEEALLQETLFKNLPENLEIKKYVHILSGNLVIKPKNYYLENPEFNLDIAPIVKFAVLTLASCLVQEIKALNSITIRGIKRIEMKLFDEKDFIVDRRNLLKTLTDVVIWIYEERTETRQKLISDRLSLDISENSTLIAELAKFLEPAFADAKDKYRFIISERVEAYYKDLQTLQTQINVQIQSYADKIRNLLGNLLRDVLAGIFLVGFSLFSGSKTLDFAALSTNGNVLLLFKGLSVYFGASFIFSSIVNIVDIRQSKGELKKYAQTTRSYMDVQSVINRINGSLRGREWSFWISFALLTLIYTAIILFCWHLDICVNKILTIYPIPSSTPIPTPTP